MQFTAQKTQLLLKSITLSFFRVRGDSTVDAGLLVRFLGEFYGIWNFLKLFLFLGIPGFSFFSRLARLGT
jgi:hypothetical protein